MYLASRRGFVRSVFSAQTVYLVLSRRFVRDFRVKAMNGLCTKKAPLVLAIEAGQRGVAKKSGGGDDYVMADVEARIEPEYKIGVGPKGLCLRNTAYPSTRSRLGLSGANVIGVHLPTRMNPDERGEAPQTGQSKIGHTNNSSLLYT